MSSRGDSSSPTRSPRRKPEASGGQKKRLHWGATTLGWDEEAYRAFLWGRTGRTSSLALTPTQAADCIREMERLIRAKGLRIPWQTGQPGKKRQPSTWDPSWLRVYGGKASLAQREIIRDRWLVLARRGYCRPDKLQEALDGFIRQRFGAGGLIRSIHDLDVPTARGLVKALIEMTER